MPFGRMVLAQVATGKQAGASTSGYSGKPLWQKLGLKPGLRVWLHAAPSEYWAWCGFDPSMVAVGTRRAPFDFGHLFATKRAELARELEAALPRLETSGMLWLSWPKKSSGVTSDISEDTLRDIALPLGLVDVKVCAVTEVWSGLKFCRRKTPGAPSSRSRTETPS
jgi:hypothetical protein